MRIMLLNYEHILINYHKGKNGNKSVDTVCREVMSEIENFARFRFVKETSCYIDILKYFLHQKGEYELLDNIPDFSLWLEFGVSEETQISMLSLGLSRQSAIALSEIIPNNNLDKQQCLRWLMDSDLSNYELSPIVVSEIEIIKSKNYS